MSTLAKPNSRTPCPALVPTSPILSLLTLVFISAPAWAARQFPPDRTLSGHNAAVMCVAYLPDGQTAVTGRRDRTVKIWNLKTGRVIRTLEAHTGFVFAVAASPDGEHVASAGGDRAVRVWEVKSGKLIALLEGHTRSVIGLKYLSNGELISAGEDGLRLWNVDKEQLIWKDGVGVSEFDASADGTRALVTDYSNGVHEVWDMVKRTRIRTLGGAAHMHSGLAMSPDGTQVYGHNNAEFGSLYRWNVATGEKVRLKVPHSSVEHVAISPDGSLLLMGSVFGDLDGVAVWDAKSLTPLRYLQGPRLGQALLAYAFSPDNKTLLATSGVYLPNQQGAHGQHDDQLLIYDLSDLRTPKVGPKAGKLSWQEVPLKVRRLTGEMTIPTEVIGTEGRPTPPWHRFRGSKGRDIILTGTSVFFQRTEGEIDEVLLDPAAHFKDLVWDGRYAWVNSQADSCIKVLDGDGHLVTQIGRAQGLPQSDCSLVLYPLREGCVLAAGAAMKKSGDALQGSGWCGIIRLNTGGKPDIDIFYKDSSPPDNWTHRKENAGRAFSPLWMTAGPPMPANVRGGKPHRCIWITCHGTQFDALPILRVDPETRGTDLFNFGPPWPQNPGPHRSDSFSPAIYWLSEDEMMFHGGAVYRVKPRPTLVDYSDKKLVIDTRTEYQNEKAPFLPIDGQLYAPGQRWARIDPHTLEVEDIGPGLRLDGELVNDDDVDYFDSAVLGPIVTVKETGQVFRFSVDPMHPLAIAASLDPVGKPLPAEGVVEFRDGLTLFYCGDGALSFAEGLLKPGRTILYPYRNPRAALDAELAHTLRTIERLRLNPSERERLNLSDDQWSQFQNHRDVPVVVDENQLQQLFAVWDRAADDAARAAAAKPLLAQAKAIGDRDTRMERDYIDRFRAIFSPRQWKLLNYEVPDK